jgi:hypothetical protein
VDTRGKKKKKASKKNVDGRCTSSHEYKTFRNRSVVKQKVLLVVVGSGRVGPARADHDQQHCYHHVPTVKQRWLLQLLSS